MRKRTYSSPTSASANSSHSPSTLLFQKRITPSSPELSRQSPACENSTCQTSKWLLSMHATCFAVCEKMPSRSPGRGVSVPGVCVGVGVDAYGFEGREEAASADEMFDCEASCGCCCPSYCGLGLNVARGILEEAGKFSGLPNPAVSVLTC